MNTHAEDSERLDLEAEDGEWYIPIEWFLSSGEEGDGGEEGDSDGAEEGGLGRRRVTTTTMTPATSPTTTMARSVDYTTRTET